MILNRAATLYNRPYKYYGVIVITSEPVTPEASLAVAITVTRPGAVAVSKPPPLIVAVPVPLTTDHVTVASVAFNGRIAASICKVLPSATVVTLVKLELAV